MSSRQLTLRFVLLLSVAIALSGCGSLRSAINTVGGWVGLGGPPKAALRDLRIVTDADANGNSACRLDLVAAFDSNALAALPATSATWFAQRKALQDGMGDAIAVRSFELPPAMLIEHADLPENVSKALAVRAYVDMQKPKAQHAIDIGSHKVGTLHLKAREVVYQAEK